MDNFAETMAVAGSSVKIRTPCDPVSENEYHDLKHQSGSDQEEGDTEGGDEEEEEQVEEARLSVLEQALKLHDPEFAPLSKA